MEAVGVCANCRHCAVIEQNGAALTWCTCLPDWKWLPASTNHFCSQFVALDEPRYIPERVDDDGNDSND